MPLDLKSEAMNGKDKMYKDLFISDYSFLVRTDNLYQNGMQYG